MWDSMAWEDHARHHWHSVCCDEPTLWHACDGESGELMPSLVIRDGVHAPHGDIFLKQTLSSVAYGALVWLLHPTHLLTYTWYSWVWLNWQHTIIVSMFWYSSVHWWSSTSTCQSTCSAPVGLSSCIHLNECAKWVALHVYTIWHACCWIPCMRPTTLLTMSTLC